MRKHILAYLTYSRREREAVITFLVLITVLQFASFAVMQWVRPTFADPPSFTEEEWAFIESLMTQEGEAVAHLTENTPIAAVDPNEASAEDLAQIGMPTYLAERMVKFREAGARFYDLEDVQRVYGMKPEILTSIAEYFDFPSFPEKGNEKKPPETLAVRAAPSEHPLTLTAPFDPNTVSESELLAFGLPEKTVRTWMNYRSSGGTFYDAADVERLYHLSETHFNALQPYFKFPEREEESIPQFAAKGKSQDMEEPSLLPASIDVNSATAVDLMQIKGIGPGYARRILNFRKKLGGFCAVDQIGTTYNLPDSVFQKARPYLKVNTPVRRINLNTAAFEELKSHPYITYKMAQQLINYRQAHGDLPHAEALYSLEGQWTPDRIDQLACYLEFSLTPKFSGE